MRIPYVFKGTPNKVDSIHKGDLRVLRSLNKIRRSSLSNVDYYTKLLNYINCELNKNKHFVEYGMQLQK